MAGMDLRRSKKWDRKRPGRFSQFAAVALEALMVLLISITLGSAQKVDIEQGKVPKKPDFSSWKLHNENIIKEEVEDKLADLDRILQNSAFASFGHPIVTGDIYNVTIRNSSLSSRVTAKTVRLKMGSLVHRGFTLDEFTIPTRAGPIEVTRIVLVYRTFIGKLYDPENLTIVSPVLGIKVYDAANLSATNATELDFVTRGADNITVRLQLSRTEVTGVPQCARFDSSGNVTVTNVASPATSGAASYVCSSNTLGDFALVVPAGSIPPASGPAAAPLPVIETPPPPPSRRSRRRSRKWRVIVGAVIGGIAAAAVLGLLIFAATRYRRKSKLSRMEQQSDRGEMLQTSLIAGSRAPTAGASRTKPVLESDYAA